VRACFIVGYVSSILYDPLARCHTAVACETGCDDPAAAAGAPGARKEVGVAEVAFAGSTVLLRHSKDPAGPVLALGRDEWTAFLAGVRHGEFDLRPERHQPGV
jgi:hypothetical protein